MPDATEIKALSEIDSEIIHWLKIRAEKEQDFRHNAHNKRTEITEVQTKAEIRTNRIGMFYAFLIIVFGMSISTFLIYLGQVLTGSIFTGATLLTSAALFLRVKK